MALPDVTAGQPHVGAHNAERHAINDILEVLLNGRLSEAAIAGIKPSLKGNSVILKADTEYLTKITINDDGTDSAVWPNRFEFEYKPNANNTIGQHLTAWFNEYGEFRVTPAKVNTVPLRIFSKELSTDADHDSTVPVFEMVYARNQRTPIFGLMGDGTLYTAGPIERRVPNGPTLKTGFLVLSASAPVPPNTPANTLIVRI